MKNTLILLIFALYGCGHQLVRDFNEPSISQGFKRVETQICDRHDVGENGCIYPEGGELGELKVYVVNTGSINIIGCGSNSSFRYGETGWFSISLPEVVQTSSDCSLDVFVSIDYPRQGSAQFPIRGMYGSVLIGRCPEGVICSYDSAQFREGSEVSWETEIKGSGSYLVRACNQEMARGDFDDVLFFGIDQLIPVERRGGKDGCAIILSIKGEKRYKKYYKVWFYVENVIPVQEPALEIKDNKVKFTSDTSVTLSVVNTKLFGQKGSFKPSVNGDYLRFYTTQGRSLVLFLKDGKVVWKK